MLFERLQWIELLGSATNGKETLQLIAQYQPDIAIIDLSMVGATAEQIIQCVEQNSFSTQLIALTMLKDIHRAQQLLAFGLSGYVLKDMAFEDLLNSIEQVRAGKKFLSPALIAQIPNGGTLEKSEIPHLTQREFEVLMCVAKGESNKVIAYQLHISQRTVCFHMTNCFIKLDATNRTEAIIKAVNYGLINLD